MGTKYIADEPFQKLSCPSGVTYYVGFGDFRPGGSKELIFVHFDNLLKIDGNTIEVKKPFSFDKSDRIYDKDRICQENRSVWMPL